MSDLERAGQDACAGALSRYGFAVKRRGLLLKPLTTNGVTGWLGLNLATWDLPAKLSINPVVGVRHVRLEKALVQLAGWKAPVACPARPLGYLMPQKAFAQWEFVADSDLHPVAEDLADAVAEYGMPFIDKWADWSTLVEGLADSEHGLLLNDQRNIVLPVIAALDGDKRKARELVQGELDRIGDAVDLYSSSYRDFAAKLFAQVGP